MTFPAFSGWKPCFSADHKQFLADHWSVIGCYFKLWCIVQVPPLVSDYCCPVPPGIRRNILISWPVKQGKTLKNSNQLKNENCDYQELTFSFDRNLTYNLVIFAFFSSDVSFGIIETFSNISRTFWTPSIKFFCWFLKRLDCTTSSPPLLMRLLS